MTGIAAPPTAPPTTAPPVGATATVPRVPQWAKLGILFGLLGVASIALVAPIGVSSTYPRLLAGLARAVDPAWAAQVPYFEKMGAFLKPETMLVLGLVIGGFLASRLGGQKAPAIETIHPAETTTKRRYWDAFLGGVLIVFGARLAGGCTSGHIISGITQLAVSGVLFGAAVFAVGIITARMLQGGR